jgi:uncharacterized protein
MDASRRGYLDIVRLLLENGADSDACDRNDSTPLMLASRGGHLDIVRVLLENGAAIDSCNYDNSTPLVFASYSIHLHLPWVLIIRSFNFPYLRSIVERLEPDYSINL